MRDLSDIVFGVSTRIPFLDAGGNMSGALAVTDRVHAACLTLLGQYVAEQFASGADGQRSPQIGDRAPAGDG